MELPITEAQTGFIRDKGRTARFMSGISGGKSFILTLMALLAAIRGRTVLYLLPTYPMIGDVSIPTLRGHLEKLGLEGRAKLNLSPPTLTIGKGKILFRSAETADRLRGTNVHDLFIDEAGYVPENVYMIALGRVRLSDDGQVRLVGTPTGAHHWYSKLECSTYTTTTMANPFIPDVFKADLLKQYTKYGEEYMRQELYGEVQNIEDGSIFISQQLVDAGLTSPLEDDPNEPIVVGLDVAASLAGDESVAVLRKGKTVLKVARWRIKDSIDLAEAVSNFVYENHAEAIVVDAPGVGGGVISGLKRTLEGSGCQIVEFWGWNPSADPLCSNKRAEMYAKAKNWLKEGGHLCQNKTGKINNWDQLTFTHWMQDKRGRILLEPKDKIRKRAGRSPDDADAFTLTFAFKAANTMSVDPFSAYGSGESW